MKTKITNKTESKSWNVIEKTKLSKIKGGDGELKNDPNSWWWGHCDTR